MEFPGSWIGNTSSKGSFSIAMLVHRRSVAYNHSQIGWFPPKKIGKSNIFPTKSGLFGNILKTSKNRDKIIQLEVCWVEGPWLFSHFNGRKSVGVRLEISYVDFSEFRRWIIQATTTLGCLELHPIWWRLGSCPALKLNDKCHVNP